MFSLRKSITQRLVFLFVITTVVPILIAGSVTFGMASNVLENENFAKLDSIAKLKVDYIENIFGEIKSDTTLAQKYLNVRTNLPILSQNYEDITHPDYIDAKEKLDEQLSGYLLEKTLVDDIFLLNKDGILVYHNSKNISKWFGNPFTFIDSITLESSKNEQIFTKIFLDEFYKSEATMFSVISIYDLDDEFIGYFVLDLNMIQIFELIQDTNGLGKTGETLLGIRDDNFAVFINPLRHDLDASFLRKVALDDEIALPIRQAVQGMEGSGMTIDYRSKPIVAVWKYIPSLDWGLVAKVDQAEAFSSISLLQQSNILLAIVFTALVGAIGFVVSKNISNPILKLKKNSELISQGKIPKPIVTNGQDELASFIRTFNQMSQDLHSSRKSLEEFRNAIDKSTTMTITDKEGIITFVNDKFCKLSKYSRDELIGKNHRIMKSGYHSNEFYKDMWDTLTNKEIWYGLIKNKTKDGEYFWLDSVIVPILDEDENITRFLSIRKDVTQQKLLESEIVKNEKLSLVGELSSRLAHDIRNPLSVISTTLENLKLLYPTDEVQKGQFEKIQRAVFRIAHQIDDVLDFVRKQPLILNKAKMSEMIIDALDSIFIPNNITLKPPKNDVELNCDARKLSVVFANLILNGIQAIDDKGTIEIRLEENVDSIVIEVEDSGSGIKQEDMDKIFEPLFTTKQQGTGLGLASVKSIIESHGGILSVTSTPTIFTITLPKTNS